MCDARGLLGSYQATYLYENDYLQLAEATAQRG